MTIILEDDTMATTHFVAKFFGYVNSLPEGIECILFVTCGTFI